MKDKEIDMLKFFNHFYFVSFPGILYSGYYQILYFYSILKNIISIYIQHVIYITNIYTM